jgi:homocysteine S-methyltransferase
VVRAVHDDYIKVGAEVITANTYASAPLMFNAHGRDADLIETDTIAMRIAREAAVAADRPICVAGSISVMRPMSRGTDDFDPSFSWDDDTVRALFDAKAANLKACGADLLIMEMMRDTKFSGWAVEAAVNTGLPVWVGIAVERNGDGVLAGVNHPDQLLETIVKELTRLNPDACLIMHSPIDTILEGLEVISANWTGPTGAYPEAGEFTMPDWQFVDIAPADFAIAAQSWRNAGAQIVGGCCGVTPDHIAALSTMRTQ